MQKKLSMAIGLIIITILLYVLGLPDRRVDIHAVVNNVTVNVKAPESSTGVIHKITMIKPIAVAGTPAKAPVEPPAILNSRSTEIVIRETAVTEPAKRSVELALKYPRALFVATRFRRGTREIRLPGRSEPLLVPEGTELISTNKPVASSDTAPMIGELKQITDGDKEGADGSFVELGPGKQFVQIDLEAPYSVYAIAVWHYFSAPRVYNDVVVSLSDDVDFVSTNTTVYNNDTDNSSGLGKGADEEYVETNMGLLIRCSGERARYVRLYSNGSTASEMNHYVEVEVYGKP